MSQYGKNDRNNEVFIPIANLKDTKGNILEYKRYPTSPGGTVITKNCKNPEVAIKWLDFALYSKEAQEMYIYGIEGLTYKLENGKKVRLPPPAGKTLEQALVDIGGRQPAHPYVQTVESRKALFPEWVFKYDDSFQKYFKDPFPGEYMPMTPAEKEEANSFMTDLTTYFSEMQAKFISGQEPFSSYDNYVATFNKIGGQRLTDINQARYDRYLKATGKK